MPDVYATIENIEPDIQKRLADVLEMRAADARQREMLASYLSEITFPPQARVLEIGCGTGGVARTLARWPGVGKTIGIDPSPLFIEKARELADKIPNLSFVIGDGRALPFEADSFDAVVIHTTLCHVPEPEEVLAETHRVLRPQGWLAVFDGDYATATIATGEFDPLEMCIAAFRENFVHDRWLVRRLPGMIAAQGFVTSPMRSHGYVEAGEGAYMLSWIDRGADVLCQTGRIGEKKAESLKTEARRRSESNSWFGHIAFASILGRKEA